MTVEALDKRILEALDKRIVPIQIEAEAIRELPSPYHLAVYSHLCRLAGSDNRTAPGLKALAKQAHMGHSKAAEVLNDLEKLGVITRTRTTSEFSGMQGRTVYAILGFSAVRQTDSVRHPSAVRQTDSLSAAEIREADSNVGVALSYEKQQHLVRDLVGAGVSEGVAVQLSVEMPDEVSRQLQALDARPNVRSRSAVLVTAIRERWAVESGPDEAPLEQSARRAYEQRQACLACDATGLVEIPGKRNVATSCPECSPY